MKTQEIIAVYKGQSQPCNGSDQWYANIKVTLTRDHLIQVLKERKHMDNIIPVSNLDSWYSLQSWSDLVSLMDCCLELRSDSYLNTIY